MSDESVYDETCSTEAHTKYIYNGEYIGDKLISEGNDFGIHDNKVVRTEAYKRYYNKCLELKHKQKKFETSAKTWSEFLNEYRNKHLGGNKYKKRYKYKTKKRSKTKH